MMRYRISSYDDGILLYGAERVLNGDIPYKDFWYIYTPGNLYLLALIFKIFGSSVLIERIFNTIISFFILICTYLLGKKVIKKQYYLILSLLLSTFCIWIDGFYANQNLPLLFSLISGIWFINYIENKKKLYLILSGIFIGLSSFFRQDFGLYTFLAVSIILIAFEYHKNSILIFKNRISQSLKPWLILLGGVLLISVPIFTYFILIVQPYVLITQFITFSTNIYPLLNIPFPLPNSIFNLITIYFPFLILFITFIWIIKRIKNRLITKKEWKIFFIFILGLISLNSFRLMAYYPHLYLAMITSIILFSFLLAEYVNISRLKNIFRRSGYQKDKTNLFFTILAVLVLLTFSLFTFNTVCNTINENTVQLDEYKGSGIYIPPQFNGLTDTINYIRENVPSDERIFIASYNNDRMIGNLVLLYYLTDRKSATKYHEMLIGIVTTPNVQDEIIGELQKNKVRYIILLEDRNTESFGATNLMKYIKGNYKAVKSIGNFTIYYKL